MTTLVTTPRYRTLADLVEVIGDIPPERVRLVPPPGEATVQDVIDIDAKEDRLCELVEGVLIEKAPSFRKAVLNGYISSALHGFVRSRKLGVVTQVCAIQLVPNLVRIPDAAYSSWASLGGSIPEGELPLVVPDLTVELLTPGNARAEMSRKRDEYFAAGVKLVWLLDLRERAAEVSLFVDRTVVLDSTGTLDGGDVLPGFTLPLGELFGRLDATPPPRSNA